MKNLLNRSCVVLLFILTLYVIKNLGFRIFGGGKLKFPISTYPVIRKVLRLTVLFKAWKLFFLPIFIFLKFQNVDWELIYNFILMDSISCWSKRLCLQIILLLASFSNRKQVFISNLVLLLAPSETIIFKKRTETEKFPILFFRKLSSLLHSLLTTSVFCTVLFTFDVIVGFHFADVYDHSLRFRIRS